MRYVAASYYPRYGDPLGTYVALADHSTGSARTCNAALLVEEAAAKAAQFEHDELPGYCDTACGDCSLCCPDILAGMAFTFDAKELFSVAELREHRRALVNGEVVFLPRS